MNSILITEGQTQCDLKLSPEPWHWSAGVFQLGGHLGAVKLLSILTDTIARNFSICVAAIGSTHAYGTLACFRADLWFLDA